jgi:LysM repeat protein
LSAETFAYKKEIDKIRYWTIKKGDTLGRIASRTGVSVSKLCKLNGIKPNTILRIGRRIRYT